MSSAALTLGDTEASKLGAMRWLSAALIGLGGPMIIGLFLFPNMADSARVAAFVSLGLLAVASASIYTISVLIPGDIVGVAVDPEQDTIEFVHQGAFARVRRSYAFEDVRDVRLIKAYDRDGYAFEAAELMLQNGRMFALPGSLSASDIVALRTSVGLPTGKR